MSDGGGYEWELRQALQAMREAREREDWDALDAGLIRFSEGLRNLVQSELANQVIDVRIELQRISNQHKEDAAGQALVNLAVVQMEEDTRTALQEHIEQTRETAA